MSWCDLYLAAVVESHSRQLYNSDFNYQGMVMFISRDGMGLMFADRCFPFKSSDISFLSGFPYDEK